MAIPRHLVGRNCRMLGRGRLPVQAVFAAPEWSHTLAGFQQPLSPLCARGGPSLALGWLEGAASRPQAPRVNGSLSVSFE